VEHLRNRYEVGAGTLREALALLVADSLVYTEGQKGFTVCPVSLDDFSDITRLRVMFETQALSQSIENGNDAWEANIISSYHQLSLSENKFEDKLARIDQTIFEEWEERNEKFHTALISACQSPWLLQFISILYHHSERYRRIGLRHTRRKNRDIHAEHEALKNAVLNRNIKLSTDILSRHITMTYDIISKLPESIFNKPALP
jgi:DNA-binding GntR family transcriptional regulator